MLHRIKARIEAFQNRKSALVALSLLCIIDTSIFPIPPDLLLVPMCLRHREKAFFYALVTVLASLVGATIGYYLGYYFFDALSGWLQVDPNVIKADFYKNAGTYIIFASVAPFPFNLVVITAGLLKFPFWTFFMYAVIGRFIRFYSVAFLSWYLGPKFRLLNKSRYKWWFYGACMVALVVIIFVLH
jgi:membrane protein YqaA with SNARE-associated domain